MEVSFPDLQLPGVPLPLELDPRNSAHAGAAFCGRVSVPRNHFAPGYRLAPTQSTTSNRRPGNTACVTPHQRSATVA